MDDSRPFDGETAATRPLGGPEKAVAGLAAALAGRGHGVTVINRCDYQRSLAGVDWLPWLAPRPPETDVLIASRKLALLDEVRRAQHRVLWYWGAPKALTRPAGQKLLERHRPAVAFVSEHQQAGWKPWRDFAQAVIPPGIDAAYLTAPDDVPAGPPRALVTTHPRHGLAEILELWVARVRPRIEDGELHIYSAGLARAMAGAPPPDGLQPVFEAIRDAADAGVSVKAPGGDQAMAAAYAGAQVHLYPDVPAEIYCATLAESQAAGLPAVALNDVGAPGATAERIHDGRTGYRVPDADAFVNLAVQLLGEEGVFEGLKRDALVLQRARSWDVAAIEFETLWGRG